MMNGISGSSGYFAQQMQGTRQQKGQGERFNQLDADANGTLDQSELLTMTDKISAMTGESINVEEVAATFDANNDGLLARDEMQSMMLELRGSMGGQHKGPGPMSGAGYQADIDNDPTSILLEMLGGQTEDQEEYSPVDLQV